MKKLGLAYNVIDVCEKGCTLFRGIHANDESCPYYQVELMVWHHNNQSVDSLVRHVIDSHQWNFVEAQCPKFAMEL